MTFCLALGMLGCQPHRESVRAYVEDHLAPIRSISPADTSFDDLEAVGRAIGRSEIVLLGEQNHGDASTFLAKVRLIEYLHLRKGFDVLAFESDFFGLDRAWNEMMRGALSLDDVCLNIYPMWTRCAPFDHLSAFVSASLATGDTVFLAGIDPRHAGEYSKANLDVALEKMLVDASLPFHSSAAFPKFKEILLDFLRNEYRSEVTKADRDSFVAALDTLQAQLTRSTGAAELTFWLQEIDNLEAYARNAWQDGAPIDVRDAQMADNLIWLLRHRFVGKKIVVWAANIHIARRFDLVERGFLQNLLARNRMNMGMVLNREIPEAFYTIGFSSHSGFTNPRAGILGRERDEIEHPRPQTFEAWIDGRGLPYAFVDFLPLARRTATSQRFMMKGFGHETTAGRWASVYDGIFYLRDMSPCW